MSTWKSACKSCRLLKCVKAGMTLNSTDQNFNMKTSDRIYDLIQNLHHLNLTRMTLASSHCVSQTDPSIYEIAQLPSKISFVPRPEALEMKLNDWIFLQINTTIDFVKKLPAVKDLNLSDRALFLKHCHQCFTLISLSYEAMSDKKCYMSMPDGSNILPIQPSLKLENFANVIKSQLVGRMIQLRVTKEEYLLMAVLFACNPSEFYFFKPKNLC